MSSVSSPRITRRERMAAQTRQEILEAARRLFAERGYSATSIADIAEEAGVAIQTIYARLDSKPGILIALLDLIDAEAGVGEAVERIMVATTAKDVLAEGIRLTRTFSDRCGDVIGTLLAAAGTEPDLGAAVAEGRRRHRGGARQIVDRIASLGGLRDDLSRSHAAAFLSAATSYEAWRELVDEHNLSWKQAEALLRETLERALLQTER